MPRRINRPPYPNPATTPSYISFLNSSSRCPRPKVLKPGSCRTKRTSDVSIAHSINVELTITAAPDQPLRLAGSTTPNDAAALRQALLDFLTPPALGGESPGPTCTIDLSALQQCDTTALQLFWAASRHAQRAGQAIQWLHPGPAVLQLAADLGIPFSPDQGFSA